MELEEIYKMMEQGNKHTGFLNHNLTRLTDPRYNNTMALIEEHMNYIESQLKWIERDIDGHNAGPKCICQTKEDPRPECFFHGKHTKVVKEEP